MAFNDPQVMEEFITKGMNFGGSADATAKNKKEGSSTAAGAAATKGMDVYQFTEEGLALQATVQGSKFWPDDSLNGK